MPTTPKGDKSLKLTPEEQEVLNYHRRNLATGMYQTNSDGSLTTFKGAVFDTPTGATLVPTYWHGQVREPHEGYRMAIKSGIKFPQYKSREEALAREQAIHDIMAADIQAYQAQRKAKP